jgi:hypothetical protein
LEGYHTWLGDGWASSSAQHWYLLPAAFSDVTLCFFFVFLVHLRSVNPAHGELPSALEVLGGSENRIPHTALNNYQQHAGQTACS